jgi:hypothetical protein
MTTKTRAPEAQEKDSFRVLRKATDREKNKQMPLLLT